MADEGTLGLARASERASEDVPKAELQRRMDETRDSISQTVTEIKETVVQQYEAVKETINDTLDWREQFKKRPVAWSLGAAGGGLVFGYAISGIVKGNSRGNRGHYDHESSDFQDHSVGPTIRAATPTSGLDVRNPNRRLDNRQNERSGPGLWERFQQTEAYGHLRSEAATVGKRFVGELSQTAQEVVLPAVVSSFRQWLAVSFRKVNTATASQEKIRSRLE